MKKGLALLFVLSLGCGGSSPPSSGGKGHMAYRPPAVATGGGTQYQMDGAEIRGTLTDESESMRTTGSSDVTKSPVKTVSKSSPERAEVDQLFVKNAWITLELSDEDDFAPAIDSLRKTAKLLGGYVADESTSGITIKVPAGRLEEAKASLDQLGEVTRENVSVVDVTSNYVDLEIRVENLRKLKTRLQELVAQGANVKEILEVEKELSRVTGQLEQLEGQMRLMKNQIAYATISVTLEESVSPGPIGWVFYGLYSGVKWLFIWD